MYPFDDVEVLPSPKIHFRPISEKYIQRLEPIFYRGEYDLLSGILGRRDADLLHAYFGYTGVHSAALLKNWPKPALVSFHGMDIMERDNEPGYEPGYWICFKPCPWCWRQVNLWRIAWRPSGAIARRFVSTARHPHGRLSIRPAHGSCRRNVRLIQASRFIEKRDFS